MKDIYININQKGNVTVIALTVLILLTIMGLSISTTSETEIQISVNERESKLAFYAAEAATHYAAVRSDLYNSSYTTLSEKSYFPNEEDLTETYPLSLKQFFSGEIEYRGPSGPPRGSGFEIETFKTHNYKMKCNGYTNLGGQCQLQVGFYRIGF